jgi:signal transduction histidine kinase
MLDRRATLPGAERSLISGRLIDLGLSIAILAIAVGPHGPSAAVALEAAVAIGLVLARRRWPVPALIGCLVAVLIATALTDRSTVLLPTTVVLVFNIAVRTDRRTAAICWAFAVPPVVGCAVILAPDPPLGVSLLAAIAWPALAATAGDSIRSRALVMAAAIERADRAEVTREQEARRRVTEERLHLARELHDLVAHNMAVVNVQASVAEHLLVSDPPAARAALRVVRSSTQAVLNELAGILSVLRSGGDSGSPMTPTPTVEEIPDLVASFGSVGLDITYETRGERHPLTALATLTAYRTTQEALANALKHGTGDVRLTLAYEAEGLRITALNAVHAGGSNLASTWGYGLMGMRERVSTVGGTLTTSAHNHSFRLEVTIPYSSDLSANSAHEEHLT